MIILDVQETEKRRGRFYGWIDGKLVVTSTTPFLSAARVLLAQGLDPATVLQMRHRKTETDSLRGPMGEAAKLAVNETGSRPRFVKYAAFQPWSVKDELNDDDPA